MRAMKRHHPLSRRHWLGCCAGLAAGLFTGLDHAAAAPATPTAHEPLAWPSLSEGWRNPCLEAGGATSSALQALVDDALDGLDATRLWDTHAHLLGVGDGGTGCSVHPAMSQWWHPADVVRRQTLLNASCVPPGAPSVDAAYVARLDALVAAFPRGARWLLFAFDQAHDDAGRPRADQTTFHVPDAYARDIAARDPARYGWVASIHPYAPDAVPRLHAAIADGALAVKWLPSAMNIDPGDPRCRPMFDVLRAHRVPLVVHCGEERAVPGASRDDLGNPLRVRPALEQGVRVIVAHCASLGQAQDTDRRSGPTVPAFDLFARLMGERAHQDLLLGDVSAVFQANRPLAVGARLMREEGWHHRLLHGSDYPLPGVMPLFAPARWVDAGWLPAHQLAPMRELRRHNALLFDLCAKRLLRASGARLGDAVFDTARHFGGYSPVA